MSKKSKKKWCLFWWFIILIIIFFIFIIFIFGFINVDISNSDLESKNLTVESNVENLPQPIKKSIFETPVKCTDVNCYNKNLETCAKTIYTKLEENEFSEVKLIREIKGIINNYCVVNINYKHTIFILDKKIINEDKTTCNIPLRDETFYLFDYEVLKYCDNKEISKTEVAEPEKICISLKQFPITEYDCKSLMGCNTEYEVKYKSNYKLDNPEINGFIIESYISTNNSDSVYCHKGKNKGENPNYWYCGTFKLTRNILNTDDTILNVQTIYAKSVFDSDLRYVKTICNDNYILPDWELEVN